MGALANRPADHRRGSWHRWNIELLAAKTLEPFLSRINKFPHWNFRLTLFERLCKKAGRPRPAFSILTSLSEQVIELHLRRERRRASCTRSDPPAHGFGENLGAWGGADVLVQ